MAGFSNGSWIAIWSERAGAEVRVESGWEAEPAGTGDRSELNERSEDRQDSKPSLHCRALFSSVTPNPATATGQRGTEGADSSTPPRHPSLEQGKIQMAGPSHSIPTLAQLKTHGHRLHGSHSNPHSTAGVDGSPSSPPDGTQSGRQPCGGPGHGHQCS